MAAVTFGIKDVYAIMNDLYRQATGQNDIAVVDTSSFINAGQKVLDTGVGNVLNSLSILVGETFFNERPYKGKFSIASKNIPGFAARKRKISFYTQDAEASGMYNTDLYTNIGDGLRANAGTGDMWEQKLPKMVEEYFYSEAVWDDHYTEYEDQIKMAFRSEGEFLQWINAFMTVFNNGLELRLEAKNRTLFLDRIAGNYLQKATRPESAVNITKIYKHMTGKFYPSKELREEHREDFLKVVGSKLQIDSDRLTQLTKKYHDSMTITENGIEYDVLRHTPKDKQRFIYYSPLFKLAKNFVLADVFNPSFIPETSGEGVESWQAFDTDVEDNNMRVQVKPALPNGAVSSDVKLDCVIGLLFDEDAIMSNNIFTHVYTTPIEAKHGYRNTFFHYRFSAYQDYSENSIMYYMYDGSDTFTGDGTTVEFTLTGANEEIMAVKVGGVEVDADAYNYDAEAGTVTFDEAPANDAVIEIAYV